MSKRQQEKLEYIDMDNIKKFEDFLDRMQGLLDNAKKQGHIIVRVEDLENTFPELKESEDERIRKWIKKELENKYVEDGIVNNVLADKAFAWLEKQTTPQVRTGLEWLNTIDDACDKRYSEEYAHGEYCHEQSFKWGFQEGVDWLEKQGEPTDINPSEFDLRLNKLLKQFETLSKKELVSSLSFYLNVVQNDGTYKADEKQDEQKPVIDFKAKNWYVSKVDGKIHDMTYNPTDRVETKFKIGDWIITPNNATKQIKRVTFGNYCFTDETFYNIIDTDNKGHLWTIQDAKNGDILAVNGRPFIYNGRKNEVTVGAYCGFNTEHRFSFTYNYAINQNVTPATKEQRDILFQKMKDDGYEWDAEKLELKEIEQKPVWNNRDENYIISAIEMVMHCPWKSYRGLYKEDVVEWLKSLKYRFSENKEEFEE